MLLWSYFTIPPLRFCYVNSILSIRCGYCDCMAKPTIYLLRVVFLTYQHRMSTSCTKVRNYTSMHVRPGGIQFGSYAGGFLILYHKSCISPIPFNIQVIYHTLIFHSYIPYIPPATRQGNRSSLSNMDSCIVV